jgi:hypothetical protein
MACVDAGRDAAARKNPTVPLRGKVDESVEGWTTSNVIRSGRDSLDLRPESGGNKGTGKACSSRPPLTLPWRSRPAMPA